MAIKKKHTDLPAFTPDQTPRLNKELKDIWDSIDGVNSNIGSTSYPVDETDTDSTKNKLVSNKLANGWETNKHARLHALDSALDHSSSISENDIMIADANGLPADSGKTTADFGVVWASSAPTGETDSGSDHEMAEDGIYLYVYSAITHKWMKFLKSSWSSGNTGELIGIGLLTYS